MQDDRLWCQQALELFNQGDITNDVLNVDVLRYRQVLGIAEPSSCEQPPHCSRIADVQVVLQGAATAFPQESRAQHAHEIKRDLGRYPSQTAAEAQLRFTRPGFSRPGCNSRQVMRTAKSESDEGSPSLDRMKID